jgi:hypothetical protein
MAGMALLAGLVWNAMAILGDGFWCLAAGERVLRTGALPDVDPFAFTSRHIPWLLQMPAFQVGGAWLVAKAGLMALMVASALPIVAAAVLLWLVPARGTWARVLAFPVALLYVLVDQDDISARGQAFGDLALAVLILALARMRRRQRVRLVWAFVLGAVWANLHPSFLLAVVLPGAFALAERLENRTHRAPAGPFLAFAGLALLGSCANPYSLLLIVDVVRLLGDPTTAKVDLFQSPPFHDAGWLVPVALAVLLLALLARAARGGRGRGDAALLLVLLLAACGARRYMTALVAFEVVLIAEHASAMVRALPAWIDRAMLAATVVEATIGCLYFFQRKDPLRDVPASAVAAVDELDLPDHVLNPYHWGGYLEWAWRGRRKAFIDGRNQLFSNGVLDDEQRIEQALPGTAALLDIYEIRTVLWESGAPLDQALAQDPAWRQVHRDALAVVYVRR